MKILILALFLALLAAPCGAWTHTKASFHTYSGLTCAARGMRIGTVLLVRSRSNPRRRVRVRVVDACGHKMKRWGRGLDLSPAAFRVLFPASQGIGAVSYRIVRKGKGRFIPAFHA